MRNTQTACALGLALICSAAAPAQTSVMSRLATAKILESKGDVVGAEKELRSALQGADESQQVVLTAHLLRLKGNDGRISAGIDAASRVTPQQPAGDPVDRLINVLNTGDQTPEVKSAIRQLGMLGDLVVPHLLRAFPKLGPFGVMNSLQVMRHSTDARIAPFLIKQLETASLEVRTSILNRLAFLPKSSGLPVAMKIAQGDYSEKQKLIALPVLLKHAPESVTCRALSAQLLASDVVDTRLSATMTSLGHKDLTEAMAIKALKSLPKKHWQQVSDLVREPQWSTFGLVVLAEAIRGGTDWQFDVIRQFSWKRVASEAALLLLTAKRYHAGSAHPVTSTMRRLHSSGWRLPKDLDDQFAAYAIREDGYEAWETLGRLLPDAAEDRVLALWERNKKARFGVFYGCHKDGKQWFRLTARHLLGLDKPFHARRSWFEINWSQAPQEAVDGLIAFAEKWPRTAPNEDDQWVKGLTEAYRDHASLPLAVVRPLVLSGNWDAWKVVTVKDPASLLQLAAQTDEWATDGNQRVAEALANYGTSQHVALALRVLRAPADSRVVAFLQVFFRSHAKGNRELIAAARFPDTFGSNTKFLRNEAEQSARNADVRNLADFVAVMPALPPSVFHTLAEQLRGQVTSANVELLGDAVLACLKRKWTSTGRSDSTVPVGSLDLCKSLVGMLRQTNTPRALPYLEAVMNKAKDYDLVRWSAQYGLNVAGDEEVDLVKRMLDSKQQWVVAVALTSDVHRDDASTRELATAAMLRLASTSAESRGIFQSLKKDDAIALAKIVLEHERFLSFHNELVQSALEPLNGYKDARYIPLLKKAVQHRSGRVRELAAQILGNTFSREAAHPLLDLLKDDEEYVRSTAQDSLNQIANYLDEREKWEKRFGK